MTERNESGPSPSRIQLLRDTLGAVDRRVSAAAPVPRPEAEKLPPDSKRRKGGGMGGLPVQPGVSGGDYSAEPTQ